MAKELLNPLLGEMEAEGAHLKSFPNPSGKGDYRTASRFAAGDPITAMLETTVLADLTGRALLKAHGRDRMTWLHGLCTQEIKALEQGQGTYACHVDIKGRIITDMRITSLPNEEALLIDLEPGEGKRIRRAFKRFIVMEDVKLDDLSDQMATLGLFGPHASKTLATLATLDTLNALPNHHNHTATVGGVEVLIVASDLFGVPGFRIICARNQVVALWKALRPHAGALAGAEALETIRVRQGKPKFGAELGDHVLFNEALLDDAVSFTKGCYLGQEVIERVDARGKVGRKLLGLRITSKPETLPTPGNIIANANRKLGQLTSVAWQEDLGIGAAMGLIHRADNAPGTALIVRLEDGTEVEAVVTLRDQIAVGG